MILVWQLIKGLLLVVTAYLLLLMVMFYTADAYLPNGAVLRRNIDLKYGWRIDLYRSEWGEVAVHDVQQICWNDAAIRGTGSPGGSFVWLDVDGAVIFRDNPRYVEALRASALRSPQGGCNGYFRPMLDPELLVDGPYP